MIEKLKCLILTFCCRFAVYGDLGNDNPQSLARLQEETLKGHFDAILHVGDMAYDMATVSCPKNQP